MKQPPEPLTLSDLLRRFLLPAVFVVGVFSVYFRAQPSGTSEEAEVLAPEGPTLVVLEGATMGTSYVVKVVGDLSVDQQTTLAQSVETELSAVNARMSTWLADSELSKLNGNPSTAPITASPDLIALLVHSREVWRASSGAFDPTIGPALRLWGFGPSPREGQSPSDDELAAVRTQTGMGLIEVDSSTGTVTKGHGAVELDLSAIAKGWGVDRVHSAVQGLGYEHVMVEIGGEVRASGLSHRGEPWRLGVERPDTARGTVHQVVLLRDAAMATSGDYRNFVVHDGKRMSHTIDPRTLRPIEHGLASVTVFADDCAEADAWATALNVLGPEEGPRLADDKDLKALFLSRSAAGKFETHVSRALAASGVLVKQ